jgi:hypothetical protein
MQEKTYMELKYDLTKKVVVADSDTFEGIDGIYFEADTQIADGEANYGAGEVLIRFSFPVRLSVATEKIGGPEEGYEVKVLSISPVEKTQVVVPLWKPGELLGKLFGRGRKERYPTASGVKRLFYSAGAKEARAYNSHEVKFSGVNVIIFISLGTGSKIQPELAELYPPSKWTFICVQRGNALEVELASE